MANEISGGVSNQTTDMLVEVHAAKIAKSQTELEGQMVLSLIQSAAAPTQSTSLPISGNSGFHVNIKV